MSKRGRSLVLHLEDGLHIIAYVFIHVQWTQSRRIGLVQDLDIPKQLRVPRT